MVWCVGLCCSPLGADTPQPTVVHISHTFTTTWSQPGCKAITELLGRSNQQRSGAHLLSATQAHCIWQQVR